MDESPIFLGIAAVTAGVVAHLVLVLLSRRIHPIFLIAGAFMLLAPLSMADQIGIVGALKYARMYSTVLMVVLGAAVYGLLPPRTASAGLLAFVAFYVMASQWSDRPILALFYKGMFALAVLAGIFLAYAPRRIAEYARGLRWLGLISGIAGLVVLGQFALAPQASLRGGRLAVWGLNANTVGMTAAALLILCCYLALHEKSPGWRRFALIAMGLLGIVVLASGSRGSLVMAVVGCFATAIPLTQRPGRLIAAGILLVVTTWSAMNLLELQNMDRLTDFSTRNRETTWDSAWQLNAEAPWFGHGWVATERGSTANLMSIYLQTLVETGLVGATVLAASLLLIAANALNMYLRLREAGGMLFNLACLSLGLVAAVLIHGLAESGALLGSTPNSLLLGFGVGMIDRLPDLAARQKRLRSAAERRRRGRRQTSVGRVRAAVPQGAGS